MGETPHKPRTTPTTHALAGHPAASYAAVGSRGSFLSFLAQQLQSYVGQHVLHIDAGMGGLVGALWPRASYVACASDDEGQAALTAQLGARPGLVTASVRAPFAEHLPRRQGGYDTILWARQTPFSALDQLALRHLRTALAPHGRILLLVTGAKSPFVALDGVAQDAQLQLRQVRQFDRLGTPVAHAQRWLSFVGLAAPVQAVGDALRPLASKWDDRWPFAGRYALAVLVHPPLLAEAECTSEHGHTVRLRPKQPLS